MRPQVIACLFMLLTPALAADPDRWEALSQEAARLTAQGYFVSALPVAVRALEEARQFGTEDPRFVDSLISTGVLSHHLGKPREAEQALRQGISIVRGRPGREEALSKLLDILATLYYPKNGS